MTSDFDFYLGARLRQARLLRDMSQEKLGLALGITFQQIQKYESAANRISCSRLVEIATAINLPLEWFFVGAPGRSDWRHPTDPFAMLGDQFLATSEGMAIAKTFPLLPAHIQRNMVTIIETLATIAVQRGDTIMPDVDSAQTH